MFRPLVLGLVVASLLSACGLANMLPRAAEASDVARAESVARRGALQGWKDEVLYFALVDRFFDGDTSNDLHVDRTSPVAYHGGDLQGLIDKLDYIKQLGVTALWVSPLVDNDDTPLGNTGMYGYHGYWGKDFTQVDEHFGTWNKAQELVTQAHARGLKVILDVVCNQAGYTFPVNDPKYQGWFHTYGNVQDWNNQWWIENGSIAGLPDFAQENPAVASFLINTYEMWADRLHVDGFRVDAVKHVPRTFWSQFNAAMAHHEGSNFFSVGEVLNGDPNYLQPYLNEAGFQSLFDFPLYYALNDVFAQGGSMKELGSRFAQDGSYPDAGMLSPFLDNHDTPRFLTQAGGDESKLRLALACLLTIRGIPMLYYGTEVGMQGGGDPDNRRDMAFGSNEPLRAYTQKLVGIRRGSTALTHGRQLEMWQDDQVYAYLRQSPDAEAVVVLNNGTSTATRTLPLRAESRMTNGTQLVEQLTGQKVMVTNHQIQVTLAGKQALILLPSNSAHKKP